MSRPLSFGSILHCSPGRLRLSPTNLLLAARNSSLRPAAGPLTTRNSLTRHSGLWPAQPPLGPPAQCPRSANAAGESIGMSSNDLRGWRCRVSPLTMKSACASRAHSSPRLSAESSSIRFTGLEGATTSAKERNSCRSTATCPALHRNFRRITSANSDRIASETTRTASMERQRSTIRRDAPSAMRAETRTLVSRTTRGGRVTRARPGIRG